MKEKKNLFQGEKTRFFGSFQHKQKQTRNKPKTNHKTTKEDLRVK